MADRIEQEFIIEAQRALGELDRVENAFASFQKRISSVSRTISNYNRRARAAIDSTSSLATNVQSVASGFRGLGASRSGLGQSVAKTRELEQSLRDAFRGVEKVDEATKRAARSSQSLTLSWETMARIVATQVIVRTFSAITSEIRQAVGEARELQRQIGLIRTIDDSGTSFEGVQSSVRALSDEFNLPIVETAVGLYNTLSNQVGDFGESLEFATEAARFAKATNSTLADSVDLLSGAMKAFGLQADDTADLAGKLFVAIDKGRVTATEVANTLGRVLEPASAVGISLEELLAGIAEISIKGTNASESMTQFRGIINAITKPTDALTEALREMGFASSEAAVQALGLPGLLDALVKSTDGSAEALARLFPRIRGIGGVFALTGENLEGFKKTTEEVTQAGKELADEAFNKATANDAERVAKALNELQNVFIEDIGNLILARAAAFLELGGGIDTAKLAITSAIPVVESLVVSLGVLATTVSAVKFTSIIAAAGPIGVTAAVIVGLVAGIKGLNEVLARNQAQDIADRIEAAGEAARKELEETKKRHQEELKSRRETDKRILTSISQRVAEANKALRPQLENIIRTNERLEADTKAGLSEIVTHRKALLQELDNVVSESNSLIRESEAFISSILRRQTDRDFASEQRDRSPEQQAFAAIQRSIDNARSAQVEFNRALRSGSEEAVKAARASLERAQSEGDAALAQAVSLKDRSLIARAEENLTQQTQRQVELEEKLIRRRKSRADAAKEDISLTRQANSEIEKLSKIIADNVGTLDDQGNPLSTEELTRRKKLVADALTEIQQLVGQGLGNAAELGITDFLEEVRDSLTRRPVELAFDIERARADLAQQQFNVKALVEYVFPETERLREALPELTIDNPEQVRTAQEEAIRQREVLIRKEQQQKEITQQRVALEQEILQAGKEVSKEQETLARLSRQVSRAPSFREDRGEEAATAQRISDLLQGAARGIFSSEDIDREIEEINKRLEDGAIRASRATLETFNEVADKIAQLGNLQDLTLTDAEVERLESLKGLEQPFTTLEEKLRASTEPAKLIEDALTRGGQALQDGANALSNATFSIEQGPVPANFAGIVGVSRFADGGFASRGTDTIPAMLSHGESVISSRNTQRFFSQIQAMNAGLQPVFRSDGGTVNVGDINVSVTGSGNPKLDGRVIADEVNRGIRLGIIKIRATGR